MMTINDDSVMANWTLKQAKQWLRARFEDGTHCPCCNQTVKLYPRKLNSNMAVFLVSLVRLWKKEQRPYKYKECRFHGRDYSYLSLWDLARTAKSDDSRKRMSGMWEPTQKGIDFVEQKIEVPSHAYCYNGAVVRMAKSNTNIIESLGDDFNYAELMQAVPENRML
jgi:hypothetical protein